MGLPGGVFSLVFGAGTGIGQALAADPRIKAVGFTGSQAGGTALMKTAAARPEPIPVYAEMASINPVFVLPGSLAVNPSALADGFVQSMTLGAGQFCTSPGLIFLPNGYEADRFVEAVGGALAQCEGQTMLTAAIASACAEGIASLTAADGVDRIAEGIPGPTCNAPAPVLFSTSMETFAAAPALQDEIFGSVALLVRYGDTAELAAAARRLQGQLTVTVQCSPAESAAARELLPVVEQKAGRLIFNGWPTGVEVNHSMVHGGPFPATSDSRTTSVGSLAIDRFQRPVSYQNIPDDLLPEPLKASNPWSLTRRIDGVLEKPRG
jgi:NADP-dependent aldehyde dehydrogenase